MIDIAVNSNLYPVITVLEVTFRVTPGCDGGSPSSLVYLATSWRPVLGLILTSPYP